MPLSHKESEASLPIHHKRVGNIRKNHRLCIVKKVKISLPAHHPIRLPRIPAHFLRHKTLLLHPLRFYNPAADNDGAESVFISRRAFHNARCRRIWIFICIKLYHMFLLRLFTRNIRFYPSYIIFPITHFFLFCPFYLL